MVPVSTLWTGVCISDTDRYRYIESEWIDVNHKITSRRPIDALFVVRNHIDSVINKWDQCQSLEVKKCP